MFILKIKWFLQRSHNSIHAPTVLPQQTLQNDHDIFNEITKMQLQPILDFCCVKGHQDTHWLKQPLSIPVQLNIDCNARAQVQLSETPIPHVTTQSFHQMPHLQILGKQIVPKLPQPLIIEMT